MSTETADLVVNGRFLLRPVTGVERVALELLRAVARRNKADGAGAFKLRLLLPAGTGGADLLELERQFSPAWLPRGHLWEQLVLPFVSPGSTLVNLANSGPILRQRQCLIMHDAAVFDIPESFTAAYRLWYRALNAGFQRTQTPVCTVSAFSKERLEHHLPALAGRVVVVPPGVDHVWRIAPADGVPERFGLERGRFVLAVGNAARHKNQKLVLRAAEGIGELGLKVVLVGGSRARVFRGSGAPDAPNVVRLGYVDDRVLRSLYTSAYAFVFPSLYEGFGLPPLEAMALGCPTVVSGIRPLTDNCADGALHVDPCSSADLLAALGRLQDPGLRRDLAVRGREQAARIYLGCSRPAVAGDPLGRAKVHGPVRLAAVCGAAAHMTAWIGGDRLRGGRAPPTAGGEPTRQRLLVWSAAAVAFVCGLALPFNVILYSVAMQDLRLLDLVSLTLVPLGLWACLHRVNLLLALILLSLLFVLPSLVHAVVLLDRHGEEYRDFVFPVRFLLAMPLCAVLIPLLESARHRTWFAVGLCLGCCLNVVPLVFQSLGQHELMVALGLAPAELDIRPWDIQQRPPGLHAHANATSAVVSLGVAAAAFLASRERQPWLLPFALAALLACSYYTETRSAFTVSLMTLSLALALRCSLDRLFLLFPLVGLAGLVIAGWSDGRCYRKASRRARDGGREPRRASGHGGGGLAADLRAPAGLGAHLGRGRCLRAHRRQGDPQFSDLAGRRSRHVAGPLRPRGTSRRGDEGGTPGPPRSARASCLPPLPFVPLRGSFPEPDLPCPSDLADGRLAGRSSGRGRSPNCRRGGGSRW